MSIGPELYGPERSNTQSSIKVPRSVNAWTNRRVGWNEKISLTYLLIWRNLIFQSLNETWCSPTTRTSLQSWLVSTAIVLRLMKKSSWRRASAPTSSVAVNVLKYLPQASARYSSWIRDSQFQTALSTEGSGKLVHRPSTWWSFKTS